MNHDDDLQEFFGALRTQDERQAPPPFPVLPVRKPALTRRLFWPLAAAAAAVLLLFIWWPTAKPSTPVVTESVLVISLESEETTQTQTLLNSPSSIDSWESPSASLIADF